MIDGSFHFSIAYDYCPLSLLDLTTIGMKRILNEMASLNKPGIYILRTGLDSAKLCSTSNMLSSITRQVRTLVGGEELEVLEVGPVGAGERSVRCQYYKEELEKEGIAVECPVKRWSVVVEVLPLEGLNEEREGGFLLYLKLRNTYTEIVVGVFSSKQEMEAFREEYYTHIERLVYCNNPLTKEYYETL